MTTAISLKHFWPRSNRETPRPYGRAAHRHPPPFRGWILYDSRCGLCRSGARKLGGVAMRRGFRLNPLQRAWVRRRLALPEDLLLRETLVLTPDGRVLGGAAAYVHVSRHVWWALPLVAIAHVPGGMRLLDWIYRQIAGNRHCISGICRLEPTRKKNQPTRRRRPRHLTTLFEF